MTLGASRGLQFLRLLTAVTVISQVLGTDNIGDRLMKDVFGGYQNDVRPICGPTSGAVVPSLGIAIRQLIELNNPEQKLITSTWFRQKWFDCRLTWDPSDYQGVQRVSVPRDRMWIPDLTLYENAESKLGEQDDYLISVNYDGLIEYNLPAVIKSMCQLNVALFPFDHQTCHLTLGSWMYRNTEVNYTAREGNPTDLTSYIPNGEWSLTRLEVGERTIEAYDSTGYSQVIFTIYLRRKPLFHVVNLILPSVIVKSLAVVGFLLPPECGEKLNLEITVLLSLLVFQLVILNSMPHSSNHLPVIAIYFLMSMVLIALSCVCTVVILNIHFNKHHTPLPNWMRQLLNGHLGRLFRLDELMSQTHEKLQRLRGEYKLKRRKQNSSPQPSAHSSSKNHRKPSGTLSNGLERFGFSVRVRKAKEPEDDSVYGFLPNGGYSYSTTSHSRQEGYTNPVHSASRRPANTSFFSINTPDCHGQASEPQSGDSPAVAVAREILKHLEQKTTGGIKKQINELNEIEWKLFAVFLDRLFLVVFLGIGFVISIVVFSYIAS